jgi:rSAM/selenodomain-associated transferase 2
VTSIVVPAWCDGAALQENLPRLAALEGDKEIVVVDGGGNEAGLAAAERVGARVVAGRDGRGPQLNAGAQAARGERLLFLHADCWLDDGALLDVERTLAQPGVGAGVFCQRIDRRGVAYRTIELAAAWRARLLRCPYGDSGLFLARAAFERIGGFPDLPLCEDLAMGRRLRRLGRVAVARRCVHLSARRWERHGLVRTTLLNWWIAGAFLLGASPDKLYRLYYGRAVPRRTAPRAAAVGDGGNGE